MTEPLALIGKTIGEYKVQRKRRSFDPFAQSWEGIHESTRQSVWLLALHPVASEDETLTKLLEDEWSLLESVEHEFWQSCHAHIRSPENQQMFAIYEPFERAQKLSELSGKLRNNQIRKIFYFLVDVLVTAHQSGVYGWLDPRQVYVRRMGEEVDIRWYRTPVGYMSHMPDSIKTTDLSDWVSYQSPESILGQGLSPASDFFSLGTILYECITGERAFFHRLPEKVREKITTGAFPQRKKNKLTQEQQSLLATLWSMDPSSRVLGVKALQAQIRDCFPDLTPHSSNYSPTDEHPALQIKEDLSPLEPESNHISISGTFASYSSELPSTEQQESTELPEPSSDSLENQTVETVAYEESEDPEESEESSEAEESEEVVGSSPDEESEEVSPPSSGSTEAKELSTASEEKSKPAQVTFVDVDEDWHYKGTIQCDKQLNVRNIHSLVLHLKASNSGRGERESRRSQSPYVRVVPIFPGCMVSPQEVVIDLRAPKVEAKFWLVPQAPVNITESACLQLWHGGLTQAEISIPCTIRSQQLTKIAGAASIISFAAHATFDPTSSIAKQPNLASQMFHQAVSLFANYGLWIGFFFLVAAIMSYYYLRPQASDPIVYYINHELPSLETLKRES